MIPFIAIYIAAFVMVFIIIMVAASWYRIVPPSEAHLVVTPSKRFVASSDASIGQRTTYFAVPASLPFFGRRIRIMDVTIKELICRQETYEKDQARYNVSSSLKYRIKNVVTAAETFVDDEELQKQLSEIVQASVRAVTVRYNVQDARAQKQKMSEEIQKEIVDDLNKWGLEMINFVLVDFQDVRDKDGKVISGIISDISRRREVEIETETRQLNAEKHKQARTKEAESDEAAKKREIQRDEEVAMREQNKEQKIAEQRKLAEEKRLEVVKVTEVNGAEIEKAKQLVIVEQQKQVEEIRKQQKKLEGEGDRDRAMEQAKGEAAPIREKGFAEAEAKEKLQEALNKFGDDAIRALVAEKIVEMQKEVGIEAAKALANAEVKVFAGGASSQQGFDLGALISSLNVSNSEAALAALNRIGRPNDLGLSDLGTFVKKKNDEPVKEKTKA